MDDKYIEADEAQKNAEEQPMTVKEELQEVLLQAAYDKISQLERVNKELQQSILEERDRVAVHCFTKIFRDTGDPKQSAVDAYRMADAFLRVRETGGIDDDKPNKE